MMVELTLAYGKRNKLHLMPWAIIGIVDNPLDMADYGFGSTVILFGGSRHEVEERAKDVADRIKYAFQTFDHHMRTPLAGHVVEGVAQ